MRNIIIFVIGITSCIVTALENRQAYIRGEYDPNIFRFIQGYEWKLTMLLACVGMLLPVFFIDLHTIEYLYILIFSGILLLTTNILNYKCYKKIRKKRIFIETIIFDPFTIILIICSSNMIFK